MLEALIALEQLAPINSANRTGTLIFLLPAPSESPYGVWFGVLKSKFLPAVYLSSPLIA